LETFSLISFPVPPQQMTIFLGSVFFVLAVMLQGRPSGDATGASIAEKMEWRDESEDV
jgi:hypothetical protein